MASTSVLSKRSVHRMVFAMRGKSFVGIAFQTAIGKTAQKIKDV